MEDHQGWIGLPVGQETLPVGALAGFLLCRDEREARKKSRLLVRRGIVASVRLGDDLGYISV